VIFPLYFDFMNLPMCSQNEAMAIDPEISRNTP
jgi:hypothetical protein